MLLATLIITFLLVVGANLIAASPAGIRGAIAFAVIAFLTLTFILSPLFFLPATAIGAFLLVIVGIVCAIKDVEFQKYLTWSLVSTGVALLCSVTFALVDLRRQARLQSQYPLVSMAPRLAYETRANDESTIGPRSKQPSLDETAAARLNEVEEELRGYAIRSRALAQLHASSVERFMNSFGFGVTRMSHLGESWIKGREEIPPLPLPSTPSAEPEYSSPAENPEIAEKAAAAGKTTSAATPSESDYWKSHLDSLSAFLNPNDFGFVRDRDHVAGFRAHRFRRPPPDLDGGNKAAEVKWKLVRLELVSLLKHDQPRVYVSKNLPRMDELKDAPTRTLSVFENQALRELSHGQDLVLNDEPNRVDMVGSLRAVEQCLDCHQTRRGRLLGAFSYEFARVPPLKAPRQTDAPPDLSMRPTATF